MKVLDASDLARAERFMWLNARLIDRHRFALHFRGGPAAPVLAALRAYENPDGGYGNALEPDLRGPSSQPVPAQHALELLHEAGADGDPAVRRLCDHLASITTRDGGVPFVLPSVSEAPSAPWWEGHGDRPPAGINPTATLAGMLYRAGADHPWLGPATEFCWAYLEGGDVRPGAYDALAVLTFLDHVPDRDRAEAAFDRVRGALLALVAPGPDGGHVLPLDLASAPGGFGRRLLPGDTVDAELDALAGAQAEDGGWTVGFPFWTPVTGPEWRGFVTVERLRILRAYGRLKE